jgi:hypothetical protein
MYIHGVWKLRPVRGGGHHRYRPNDDGHAPSMRWHGVWHAGRAPPRYPGLIRVKKFVPIILLSPPPFKTAFPEGRKAERRGG